MTNVYEGFCNMYELLQIKRCVVKSKNKTGVSKRSYVCIADTCVLSSFTSNYNGITVLIINITQIC